MAKKCPECGGKCIKWYDEDIMICPECGWTEEDK